MAAARSNCQGKGMGDANDKAERLAKALRENLKRRKSQARGLQKPEAVRPPED
jgi:hypothetical protein